MIADIPAGWNIDPRLTKVLGVEVQYAGPKSWPQEYGPRLGWYLPDGPVRLRLREWERIDRTLQGKYAPSFYTARAWHTLAHEYAHRMLGAPGRGTVRHPKADKLGLRVMPWLMSQAGIPPEQVNKYVAILKRNGWAE